MNNLPYESITEIRLVNFLSYREEGILSAWIPRRWDIFFIANFFKMMGCLHVLDVGCGSGFLGCLLAMEGVPVTGIDINIPHSHRFWHSLLNLKVADIRSIPPQNNFDGAFVSWADQGFNPSPYLVNKPFKALVLVMETTGITGDALGRYITDLLHLYKPLLYWDNVNFLDINHTLRQMVKSGVEKDMIPVSLKTSHNRVVLFGRRGEKDISEDILKISPPLAPYPWEKELDMYYNQGEKIEGGRITLWKIKRVEKEDLFLRDMVFQGIIERGLIL